MKNFFVYILLSAFIFPGCTRKKPNIITYDLKRSDYLESIDATGTIQAVNNTTILAPMTGVTNLIPIVHLAEQGAHVKKGDTICIFNVPDLLSIVESFNRDLEKMEGDMRKLEADNAMQLSLLNAQIETNKAQMAISMLDSIQIKFAPPVKQKLLALEMEKVNIEKKKLQKKFAAQKKIDNSELIQMRSRIMMQKSRLQMFQNQINLLKIVSPVDGIIMHVENYRLEGGTILFGKIEEGSSTLSNMSVLQIPDMKEMQVLVEVPEADYKRIENGQKVLISVEAATNLVTTGKIKRKTLAGKNPQMQTAIKSYEVIISVDSCHSDMIPGLSASCRIIVDQVKDTIVVPTAAIFVKDSTKIVYVAEDYKFLPVTVETGLSNSSRSIVSKGLEGNETIALIEPPHNLIRNEVKSKADTTAISRVGEKESILIKSTVKN